MIALKPRRLNDRLIKLQQKNKKLLIQKEVLNVDELEIDDTWDFDLDSKYIKCKKIVGGVTLLLNHIPDWLSNIEIDGNFDCSLCRLKSLKNCPKIIHGYFSCSNNKLITLEDGPTFVDGDYYCYANSIKFTEEYVKSVCNVKNDII